jgi:uncharacterized membrane protein YdjX (TVP38/TMEM64 family)
MSSPKQKGRNKGWRSLAVFLAFAVAAVVISVYTPVGRFFSVDAISALAERLGVWGPLAIAACGTVMPLLFLPRWPIAFVGGLVYGVVWGTLLANVASTLGAWLHFIIATTLLAPGSDRIKQRYNINTDAIPPEKTFMVLFFFRAFPLSNFVATNLLAGALKVPIRTYLAATFFGMIPSTIMYASWGKLMKKPSPAFYALAVLTVTIIIVGTYLARKHFAPWFRQMSAKEEEGKG